MKTNKIALIFAGIVTAVVVSGCASMNSTSSPRPAARTARAADNPPEKLVAGPGGLSWPKSDASTIEQLMAKTNSDPVSVCLSLQAMLGREKNKPTGAQREWLMQTLATLRPACDQMLTGDFDAAVAQLDLRDALISQIVGSQIDSAWGESRKAQLVAVKSRVLAGEPPAKPVWRLSEVRGEFLPGEYTENEETVGAFAAQPSSRWRVSAKQGFRLARVSARVQNVSPESDPPYTRQAASKLKGEMSRSFGDMFVGGAITASKPARMALDDFAWLVLPGGDIALCSYVCAPAKELRGAVISFPNNRPDPFKLFMGQPIAQGDDFLLDCLFVVPDGVNQLRLLVLGAVPEPVRFGPAGSEPPATP